MNKYDEMCLVFTFLLFSYEFYLHHLIFHSLSGAQYKYRAECTERLSLDIARPVNHVT